MSLGAQSEAGYLILYIKVFYICPPFRFCRLNYSSYLCSMKITTKISTLDTRTQNKIVHMTLRWCQAVLGINNRRKNDLSVYIGPQPEEEIKQVGAYYGCYDCITNQICIYPENHNAVRELIKTVIHEYTHYTQPVRSRYYKYDEQYGYSRNPFEVQARKNEELLYKHCWKVIKPLV